MKTENICEQRRNATSANDNILPRMQSSRGVRTCLALDCLWCGASCTCGRDIKKPKSKNRNVLCQTTRSHCKHVHTAQVPAQNRACFVLTTDEDFGSGTYANVARRSLASPPRVYSRPSRLYSIFVTAYARVHIHRTTRAATCHVLISLITFFTKSTRCRVLLSKNRQLTPRKWSKRCAAMLGPKTSQQKKNISDGIALM